MPIVCAPAALSPCLQLWHHEEFPRVSLQRNIRLGPGLWKILCNKLSPDNGQLCIIIPSGILLKMTVPKEYPLVGSTLITTAACLLFLGEMSHDYVPTQVTWPVVCLDSRELGRTMIRKLVTRNFRANERLLWKGKKKKQKLKICAPCECSNDDLGKEDLLSGQIGWPVL